MSDKNDIVIIELDRPRVLRYGHKALKTMSKLINKDIDSLVEGNFDVEEVEKIIYCGLLTDAKENGENALELLEKIEDLLDEAPSYQYILQKMTEALNVAFGNLGDEKNSQGVATPEK